jgi:hypothetical protein
MGTVVINETCLPFAFQAGMMLLDLLHQLMFLIIIGFGRKHWLQIIYVRLWYFE